LVAESQRGLEDFITPKRMEIEGLPGDDADQKLKAGLADV
jgi:hypothetical protein